MSRTSAIAAENAFIKGLVTETTALRFPKDACTETFDCVFDETGVVTRRPGFAFEEDGSDIAAVQAANLAYTEYRWESVAGDGNKSFMVQQHGKNLLFFDISVDTTVSANAHSTIIDLETLLPADSSLVAAHYPLQYTSGNGNLIIASAAIEPTYISYDTVDGDFVATTILIQIRDFDGVDSGIDDGSRPSSTVADLKTNNPAHYYNLLNQSWALTDALGQWDTARSDLPNNYDYVALYRNTPTDAFDNARIDSQNTGNRLAPKGHFLLTPYNVDRDAAMIAGGFTGATLVPPPVLLSPSVSVLLGTEGGYNPPSEPCHTPTNRYSQAFNGDTTQTDVQGTATLVFTSAAVLNVMFAGRTFNSPQRISQVKVYGSTNVGFIQGSNPNVTINLYGKQGTRPTSNTDGTLLGTLAFNDTTDESAGRTVSSSDTATFFDHCWITLGPTTPSNGTTVCLAELEMYTVNPADPTNVQTVKRPKTVEFYAGRVWYAGLDDLGLNNSLYFSQITTADPERYGKCYQANDPTAEDFFDLLPDDGGTLRIPEMGSAIRLFAYQSSLIVLASNGLWLIKGGSAGFVANDYVVKRISNQGTNAPHSVISFNGLPVWWGDDGIFTLQYSAEYDSFSVVSMSDGTIKSFFSTIPVYNRSLVKGAYDSLNAVGYWLYYDAEPLTEVDYKYNKVLVLNAASKAFYPWTIGQSEDLEIIRGICYVQDATRTAEPAIKYTTTYGDELSYSETKDVTDWLDWGVEDYNSYFITGYRIDGQAQKFFQSNYVFIYMNEEEDASCWMQGLWDWTTNSSTGKWSTEQQIYNNRYPNRVTRHRRLLVRGKGKALQLKFRSEEGKPFSIIGWSIWETASASV